MWLSEKRHWFLQVAESMLHLPYRWGGDDPSTGFDCSGMVIECLRSVGMAGLKEDTTADGLWHKFHQYECKKGKPGALVFWFDDAGKATHVAICVSNTLCITADGGGSFMSSDKEPPELLVKLLGEEIARFVIRKLWVMLMAEKRNAFAKIRSIEHRIAKPRFVYIWEDE